MDPGASIQLVPFAAGNVTGGTGATPCKAGDVAVARSSTGVYTLTHANNPGGAESVVASLSLNANSGIIRAAFTSATVVTVSTFAVDGTTATDKDFGFALFLVPQGTA